MSHRIRWSYEKYRIALMGDELPGLRRVVDGFTSADGYDLRRFGEWTSSMRRRIRTWYERVHLLEAQERTIVFPRNKKNLRKLQEAFHGDIPSRKFKAAFVPYTAPRGARRDDGPPEVRYHAGGAIDIATDRYTRRFVPFDKEHLARRPGDEIDYVVSRMPGAGVFFIQTGEFQTLNGRDATTIKHQVARYMSQYDGRQPLPRGSGNRGDDPRHHHYSKWLNGIIGYRFEQDEEETGREVVEGIAAAKRRRQLQDNRMKSKGAKRARTTPWYPGDVEPVREGWYEVLEDVEHGVIGRRHWRPGVEWDWYWRGLAK